MEQQLLRKESRRVKKQLAAAQQDSAVLQEQVVEMGAALEAMSAQNQELGLQLLRQQHSTFS